MIYRQKPKKTKQSKMVNKTKTNIRDRLRGLIFCCLWYLSIIAGFFLLICPILPLALFSPKRYRKWSDIIFGMWEPFPVAIMEVFLGVRVMLTGDNINPFESSLFIMNHRTRVDWNFLWMGLFHCCKPNAHNMKYVLKAPIMHFPGAGWVMQTCSFIFIHRNWEKDKPLLDKMIDYLNDSDELYQVLIFPEGTDLTENNIQKSHKYADKHNLERYYKVLHPKTTGFAFLANKMKSGGQLKAIYDVTIAYPKTTPQNEADLFSGKFPEEVHFHFKRYSSSNIPCQDDDLRCWLKNIWQEKEKKLQNFYATGCFTFSSSDQDDDVYVPNQKIDFGKTTMTNGNIKYTYGEPSNVWDDIHCNETDDGPNSITSSLTLTSSKSENHFSTEEIYKSKSYRPSHLLYLVLVFWLTLIAFTIHQLFYNSYLQIWILTHSLFFTALSFVSNGFHQIAASIYFYAYERKPNCVKKSE